MGRLIGSMGNDKLVLNASNTSAFGLGGDDVLTLSWIKDVFLAAYGGTGNDVYVLENGTNAIIADSGGHDAVRLGFPSYAAQDLVKTETEHGIIDNRHYLVYLEHPNYNYSSVFMIKDFRDSGKIDKIIYTDNVEQSFDDFWNMVKDWNLFTGSLSEFNTIESGLADKINTMLTTDYDAAVRMEQQYSAVPAWFSPTAYVDSKALQLRAQGIYMSTAELEKAFSDAGYEGTPGKLQHFFDYGQWEDTSPSSLFDANYYYTSKAASFYGVSVSQVTSAQAETIRKAVHGSGMNAWNHYQAYGTREGIDPSKNFDTDAYLANKIAQLKTLGMDYSVDQLCDAFEEAGFSALEHYEIVGKTEGIPLVGVSTALAEYSSTDVTDV